MLALFVAMVAEPARADQPVLWLGSSNVPVTAVRADSLLEVLPRKETPEQWTERVWRLACAVAANGAGQMAVTVWPASGLAVDAVFVVQLGNAGGDERAMRGIIERLTHADAPPSTELRAESVKWAWACTRDDVVVAVGPNPVVQLKNPRSTTLPSREGEFPAHAERWRVDSGGQSPVLAVFLDLNAMRQQAPERFATGPEGRLVEQLRLANARALGAAACLHGTPGNGPLAGRSLLTIALSWSARSQPPGTVRGVRIGEAAWPERESPPAPPPPVAGQPTWVFAMRTDAGAGPLSLGWGGLIRQYAALGASAEPDAARSAERVDRQNRWFMAQSGALREVTSRLDRYMLIYPSPESQAMLQLDAPMRSSAPPDDAPLIGALRTLVTSAAGMAVEPPGEGGGVVAVGSPGLRPAVVRIERDPVRVIRVAFDPLAIPSWLLPAEQAR